MRTPLRFLLGIPGIVIGGLTVDPAGAQQVSQDASRRAAIHPVADPAAMQAWLSRVPLTRDFPPDFSATLKGDAPAFVVEMTTRSEEHTSELQSLMRISYAVFCLINKIIYHTTKSIRLKFHMSHNPMHLHTIIRHPSSSTIF